MNRGLFRAALRTALALVVLVFSIEAERHAHVPHATADETVSFHLADEDGAGWCSICRLSHQVSSAPVLALAVTSLDDPSPAIVASVFLAASRIEPAGSPRAPPRPTCS